MNIDYIKYEIGRAYTEDVFISENSGYVERIYRMIAQTTERLYNLIPYDVEFTDDDPYESSKEMRSCVKKDGKIKIYTESSGHPFLTKDENCKMRAVHDVWAHLVCGCPFTFQGEYTAYLEQRKYYPDVTWSVLFAEIPAQTCAYYYNKSFDFKQRAIEAPNTWMRMCKGIEKDYSYNSIMEPLLGKGVV